MAYTERFTEAVHLRVNEATFPERYIATDVVADVVPMGNYQRATFILQTGTIVGAGSSSDLWVVPVNATTGAINLARIKMPTFFVTISDSVHVIEFRAEELDPSDGYDALWMLMIPTVAAQGSVDACVTTFLHSAGHLPVPVALIDEIIP